MPEPFASLVQQALGLARDHQYVLLFLLITIEEAGIPLPAPGDLVIAYYGWRSGGDPYEIAQVILACALGSATGTLAPYALARRFGRAIALRLARWLDVDQRRVDDLSRGFAQHGFRDVLLTRLVPGLRVAVSLIAGTSRVPLREFTPAVFIAATLYWTGWTLLGAIVGPHLEDVLSPAYIRLIVIAIPVVFVSLFVGRLLWARRSAARA